MSFTGGTDNTESFNSPSGSEGRSGETPPRSAGPKTSRRAAPGAKRRPVQPPPATSIPKKEPDTADIVNCWGQLLGLPAIVHVLPGPYQCEVCAEHIANQAPQAAKDLVRLSESHPQLRKTLVTVTNFFGGISLLGSVGDLYGPSFANHGPYVPGVTELTTVAGAKNGVMPHRAAVTDQPKRAKKHNHRSQPEGRNASTTPPNPAPVAPEPNTGL